MLGRAGTVIDPAVCWLVAGDGGSRIQRKEIDPDISLRLLGGSTTKSRSFSGGAATDSDPFQWGHPCPSGAHGAVSRIVLRKGGSEGVRVEFTSSRDRMRVAGHCTSSGRVGARMAHAQGNRRVPLCPRGLDSRGLQGSGIQKTPTFAHALMRFAVDPETVAMTTKLAGEPDRLPAVQPGGDTPRWVMDVHANYTTYRTFWRIRKASPRIRPWTRSRPGGQSPRSFL
jgi:hypothetical protein